MPQKPLPNEVIGSQVVTVEIECRGCEGTGVYRGFAEPKGVGVVCLDCDGSGKDTITFTQFTERKTRNNIKLVFRSRGALVAGGAIGPDTKNSVTYEEFLNGKMP